MFASYALQYNNVARPTGWQNLTVTPPVTGTVYEGMNIVTLPAAGTQQYFRLTNN
jgi:hypothetical protein